MPEQINQLINDLYGIKLYTCGNCGHIVSSKNIIPHCVGSIHYFECPICHSHGHNSDFPDLFY